jgi:predicted acylesterase/phospholipase RssA
MSRTVRLALVMNGGISLAVWMGGVAKELDLAVRASQGRRDGLPEEDLPQFEKWRELCTAHGGVTIEIDIVAGTSAGGLNGTLLATSYGLGAALPDLKQMWRTSASISPGALLPPATESSSILDGAFFATKVREVLGAIRDGSGAGAVSSPITLFVTGTALGNHLRSYEDSFQQGFRSPDHRRVYRFRSQPPSGEANEFEKSFEALGLAARASAGFPVAFAPVEESRELLALARGPQDFRGWLMDGGVLDNAPFGPVLEEIVTRPVDTDVHRIVVYVVPSDGGGSPAPVAPAPPTAAGPSPSWFTVLRSALSFPGEADFRDDLEELTRIFATADAQRGAALLALRAAVDSTVSNDVSDALRAGSTFLREQYAAQQPRYDQAAFVERIQGRTGKAIRLAPVLGADSEGSGPVPDELGAFGHSAAERMVRNMLADLRQRLEETGPSEELGDGAGGVSAALGALVQQREGLEDAVVVEAAAFDGPAIGDLVTRALARGAEARRDQLSSAIEAYARAVGASGAVATEAVMAVEIVTQALAPQVRSAPPPFQLLRLGPDNVSPLAPSAAGIGDQKLYGTRLGHFGAFGKEEWRTWDWGWGRLDVAAQLGRALGLATDEIRDLQQGVWQVEGDGQDLEAATVKVGNFPEEELRRSFGSETVDGLLDSAARMLHSKQADLPELVATVAPKLGTTLRTRFSLSPLWLVPGITIRRKLRRFFR